MKKQNANFTVAHITDDMHMRLKKIEEDFERQLGKRIALVAYEEEGKR